MKFFLWTFLIWRISLFVPLYIGQTYILYRSNQGYTNILDKISKDSLLNNTIFYPWANFDGVHYLAIAGYGYTTEGRFFPLYPMLINLFSSVFPNHFAYSDVQFLVGLILSNTFFAVALFFLYKLIKIDFSSKIAKKTIFYLLIFPTSFFFVSLYSESLFFMLLILTFYFANKKNWLISSIFAMLLSTTRLVGILILPVLIYQIIASENIFDKIKKRLIKIQDVVKFAPILIIPLGFLAYAYFNFNKWGSYLYFITNHSGQGNGRSTDAFIFPLQTIFRYTKILISFSFNNFNWWIAMFELVSFIFASFLLYFAWKKNVKITYILFSSLAFLLPVLSGTFSGIPRYVLVLIPIFISLAMIKNIYFKVIYSSTCILLLIIFLAFFSRGYFVA